MAQSFYTLPDLVDLALKVPETGAVNFNILHTVLHTLIVESRLQNVRPTCHIENPLLAKASLKKAKIQAETEAKEFGYEEKPRPQTPPPADRQNGDKTLPKSEEKAKEKKTDPESSIHKKDAISEEMKKEPLKETEEPYSKKFPTQSPDPYAYSVDESKEMVQEKEICWDDVTQKIRPDKKSPPGEEKMKVTTTLMLNCLTKRILATEEGLTRLTEIIDGITNKMKRKEGRRTSEGVSIEELEFLAERVEDLEEAREVFEEDHVQLSDVLKTQKKIVKEFEEIKTLGSEIKEMKREIAAKADLKEMEEALALKGDLELVNTKVDQTEFETAIEELGEAIGRFGIKFQKKNEEWEERAADIRSAIDGKMSRDIFDEAILKIDSRLSALMYGLQRIKKVVESLLYPDASGVTRCLVCKRPAGISGHDCLNPNQLYKQSEDNSNGSGDKESFLKSVDDALAKQPKRDEPPFCASRDTIISIPFSSSTNNSAAKETFPETKVDLRLAPINQKNDNSRQTSSLKYKSQVPKLPEINRHESAHPLSKQKQVKKFPGPKLRAEQQQEPLIFTPQALARLQKDKKLIEFKASFDILSDSADNLQSFAPMRLMQDPLRKEIIPPETNHQNKPNMIVAPLSTSGSSTRLLQNRRSEKKGNPRANWKY